MNSSLRWISCTIRNLWAGVTIPILRLAEIAATGPLCPGSMLAAACEASTRDAATATAGMRPVFVFPNPIVTVIASCLPEFGDSETRSSTPNTLVVRG
jgi:hypothetical protein